MVEITENIKICSVCHEHKPKTEFHKNKNTKDGLTVTCKPCAISRSSRWQKENPERVTEVQKMIYRKNPKKTKISSKKRNKTYYQKHTDAQKQRTKEYRQRHPERHREQQARRRSRKKQAGIYLILEKELKALLSRCCVNCGTNENITLDHIVPISRGGRHSVGNLQPLCLSCNSKKNNMFLIEWYHYSIMNGENRGSLRAA